MSTFDEELKNKSIKLIYCIAAEVECIKNSLLIGGITFIGKHVTSATFNSCSHATGVILQIGDLQVIQKQAILRYCGKLSKTYPENILDALMCDELIDLLTEFRARVGRWNSGKSAEKILSFPNTLENKIGRNGSRFCVGDKLTIVDLLLMDTLHWTESLESHHAGKGIFNNSNILKEIYSAIKTDDRFSGVLKGNQRRTIRKEGSIVHVFGVGSLNHHGEFQKHFHFSNMSSDNLNYIDSTDYNISQIELMNKESKNITKKSQFVTVNKLQKQSGIKKSNITKKTIKNNISVWDPLMVYDDNVNTDSSIKKSKISKKTIKNNILVDPLMVYDDNLYTDLSQTQKMHFNDNDNYDESEEYIFQKECKELEREEYEEKRWYQGKSISDNGYNNKECNIYKNDIYDNEKEDGKIGSKGINKIYNNEKEDGKSLMKGNKSIVKGRSKGKMSIAKGVSVIKGNNLYDRGTQQKGVKGYQHNDSNIPFIKTDYYVDKKLDNNIGTHSSSDLKQIIREHMIRNHDDKKSDIGIHSSSDLKQIIRENMIRNSVSVTEEGNGYHLHDLILALNKDKNHTKEAQSHILNINRVLQINNMSEDDSHMESESVLSNNSDNDSSNSSEDEPPPQLKHVNFISAIKNIRLIDTLQNPRN